MAIERAHILVSGRVQGVSFRAYAEREARRIGVRGYVRNLPSGQVEIVAEGDEADLTHMIAWARRGPSLAHVDDLQIAWSEPSGEFPDFRIRY